MNTTGRPPYVGTALLTRAEIDQIREQDPEADRWAGGFGAIIHSEETQARVFQMARQPQSLGGAGDGFGLFEVLHAADRLANAAMWLVVHQTYAANVYLDGRTMGAEDFRPRPEGHTGGALNVVPGYVGYLALNAITGRTRSWILGQGHTVAAIDSTNVLVGNMTPRHAERYGVSDAGLSTYVQDFYRYEIGADGRPVSPLGSHVNVHTAGAIAEGGYLGFTELEYMHMPLPGEHLVTLLSDGAFEEQRGSDWAPRWWHPRDTGVVTPIMINNGRRIDQRSTFNQAGGTEWFEDHLSLNSFDPVVIDGRDPAAYVWLIHELETRLQVRGAAIEAGELELPVRLPYGIAVAPKGAGFANEGTNLAHNLPLMGNPHHEPSAAATFNEHASRLWVPEAELRDAIARFNGHTRSGRLRERDHPLAHRHPAAPNLPTPEVHPASELDRPPEQWVRASPMRAFDAEFLAVAEANPELRVRIGNPDEMRSNRMQRTLDALKFRATSPEEGEGVPESRLGAVITALNEEAVASAALGNKAGLNLVVSYEAFAAKMQGVMRQEVIFAAHQVANGTPPGWLSVPFMLTSHTWENSKNEQSHQDPALAESMLGEMSHISRVLFVPDANTAAQLPRHVYATRGQIWSVVVPKGDTVPSFFSPAEASQLYAQGAIRVQMGGRGGESEEEPEVILTAIGGYQLEHVLRASARLSERGVTHRVIYMLEPGRFREPRDRFEAENMAAPEYVEELYGSSAPARVFNVHTRPEAMSGALWPLIRDPATTRFLGYRNQGATVDVEGLLFLNEATWAHVLREVARVLRRPVTELLDGPEIDAIEHRASPHGPIIAAYGTGGRG